MKNVDESYVTRQSERSRQAVLIREVLEVRRTVDVWRDNSDWPSPREVALDQVDTYFDVLEILQAIPFDEFMAMSDKYPITDSPLMFLREAKNALCPSIPIGHDLVTYDGLTINIVKVMHDMVWRFDQWLCKYGITTLLMLQHRGSDFQYMYTSGLSTVITFWREWARKHPGHDLKAGIEEALWCHLSQLRTMDLAEHIMEYGAVYGKGWIDYARFVTHCCLKSGLN